MNTISDLWRRLREHRLLFNLLLIAAVILLLAVAAHIVMQAGTRHGARRTVPDFTGIPYADAERLARKQDLKLHINDSLYVPAYDGGTVLDQLPEEGVEVKPGRMIYLTINAYRAKMVPIPYVAERSLRQAKNMLEIAGLEIAELRFRPDIATNYVLEEHFGDRAVTPDRRIEAEMGSGVTLVVGLGADAGNAVVPQVVGLDLRKAKGRLWEQGLNIGEVRFDEGIDLLTEAQARVYVQSPAAEHGVAPGTRVALHLTLDAEKLRQARGEAETAARDAAARRLEEERERADSLAAVQLTLPAPDTAAERPQQDSDDSFFD